MSRRRKYSPSQILSQAIFPAYEDEFLGLIPDEDLPFFMAYELEPPRDGREYIYWAGTYIPLDAWQHQIILGQTGSGKTLHTHLNLISVIQCCQQQPDRRIVIFDTKGDTLPLLEGLGVDYMYMNVNDQRASAWALAADHLDYDKIIELAHILCSDSEAAGGDQFFRDAARLFLGGIMMSFAYRHGPFWGLHDVYNALTSDIATIKEILGNFPRGSDIINAFIKTTSEKTLDSIRMQIATHVLPLMVPAAHEQRATREQNTFTLDDFLRSDQAILVIAQDAEARAASNPLIHALFRRLVDKLVAGREVYSDLGDTRKTFIYIDEANYLGRLPGVQDLAIFSRSKGTHLNLTSQGISGLIPALGGRDKAMDVLSNLNYIAIHKFKGSDYETANLVRNLFGQTMRSVWNQSFTSEGLSLSRQLQMQPRIPDDVLLFLKPASRKNGLTMLAYHPESCNDDQFQVWIPGDLIEQLKPRIRRGFPSQIAKQRPDKIPQQWTEEQRRRLVKLRTHSRRPLKMATDIDPVEDLRNPFNRLSAEYLSWYESILELASDQAAEAFFRRNPQARRRFLDNFYR